MPPSPTPPFGLFKSKSKEFPEIRSRSVNFQPEEQMAAYGATHPQEEDYWLQHQEGPSPVQLQYDPMHEFPQERQLQPNPGPAIVYQPSERTGSQPGSPTTSTASRRSKLSKRSPRNGASVVHAGAQVESSAGRTPPHLRSPHSDSGTLPGSPVGLGHPSGVHQVYMNPAPPTTISIIDAPSMTPTPSPPPPPPKRKSSLKRLFMPTWSRTSLPETRNVGGETDTPAVGAQRPSVEPVPVSMPIQPKRKGSLAGRLFRNRSRSLVTEPPDPQEEVVTIPSRQESYVAPNPPERKRSFGQGLFRSRSRTAAVETEDAPSVYSRGESPTTQSVGSKKRFGIFRKTSRDMPATPEAETFHPSGSAVFLGNVPTRSSLDDGAPDSASASTPKRSRNPFNIFRKKSTDSSRGSVEEYAPERAESFPPQEGVTPTSGTFQDMDAPAPIVPRPKPKRSWTDRLLGRNKAPRIFSVVHEEPEEMLPEDQPPLSPQVERQLLTLDPAHQADVTQYPSALSAGEEPPPVVDLVAPRGTTSPRHRSPQPTYPDGYHQSFPERAYPPKSPPASILQTSVTRRAEPPGITHVMEAPRSTTGPVYHVYPYASNTPQDPVSATPGHPVNAGNWRVSVRGGDEDDRELSQTYPYTAGQEVGGQSQHNPSTMTKVRSGAQVVLQPGQEYELPADGNAVLVVQEGMDLEVKDPVTGEFVPYNEEYIARQVDSRRAAYEETYFIPPGKIVEFQDEEGNILYRSGGADRRSGIHDLGNGIQGAYDPDGAYVLHLDGDTIMMGDQRNRTAAKPARSPTRANLDGSLYGDDAGGSEFSPRATEYRASAAPPSPPESFRHPASPTAGSYRPEKSPPPESIRSGNSSPHYAPTYDTQQTPNTIRSPSQSLRVPGSPRSDRSLHSQAVELIEGLHMLLEKNEHWKPHGPMDYARSVRKWNIGHSRHCPMSCHDGSLFHRMPQEGLSLDRSVAGAPPGGVQGSQLTADDVQNDLEYVVPVVVGTPGQIVRLDFDTGSSDLWVWSTHLHASTSNLKSHRVYDPRKSSTARSMPGMTWKISYGDGSNASGIVYSDVLTFNKLTVPNQAIEAADRLSPTFLSENGSDGLLGLAFPILNTIKPHPQKTPVQHLIEQKIISQPIFCAKLVKGGSGSYYTFGYIPQNVVDRNRRITYVDVDSSHGFWEFPCPQLRVGQHTVNQRPGNTAIADTGTTLILLEDSVLDDIYGQIRGARTDRSGWVLPSNAHCPDVSFSIGGNFFSISGEDLKFADSGNGMSFGAIQSRGSNRQDILGDVFLKRVLAVFDQTPGRPRLGLGQRSFNERPTQPPSRRGR